MLIDINIIIIIAARFFFFFLFKITQQMLRYEICVKTFSDNTFLSLKVDTVHTAVRKYTRIMRFLLSVSLKK